MTNPISPRQEKRILSGVFRLCTIVSLLFLLLYSISIAPIIALLSFSVNQPLEQILRLTKATSIACEVSCADEAGLEGRLRSLLANIPALNAAPTLLTTNYPEDRAIREAILAKSTYWQLAEDTQKLSYQASNTLRVSLRQPDGLFPISIEESQKQLQAQSERTVLTARLLLGLWHVRRNNARLSLQDQVVLRPDEILAWRGVQKHQRRAYVGAEKRFSDGYQWKHKQQVFQDMSLLERYYLQGTHTLQVQGKKIQLPVESPYLRITPLYEVSAQGAQVLVGYAVAPGNWIVDYEAHEQRFLLALDRRIFRLHPQNEQLALRIGLYLAEHWRQSFRSGEYKAPLVMADLLSASMITVDKANLTSRFAPRVEAALHTLYIHELLGAVPSCLSSVDKTKSQWGNAWLASYWSLLPPQQFLHACAPKKQNLYHV